MHCRILIRPWEGTITYRLPWTDKIRSKLDYVDMYVIIIRLNFDARFYSGNDWYEVSAVRMSIRPESESASNGTGCW